MFSPISLNSDARAYANTETAKNQKRESEALALNEHKSPLK